MDWLLVMARYQDNTIRGRRIVAGRLQVSRVHIPLIPAQAAVDFSLFAGRNQTPSSS
jgi:hypothetical protein